MAVSGETSIERVEGWLRDRGWLLNRFPGLTTNTQFGPNVINLNSKTSLETQLFSLLHECGHVALGYPETSKFVNAKKRTKYTLWHRVARAANEVRAWDKGLEIARESNVRVHKGRYERYQAQWLLTYFKVCTVKYS